MRLLLCDDHRLLLESLTTALTAHGHDVVGTVTDPTLVAETAEQLNPDVCLLDLVFPGGDGLEAARELAVRAPSTKVLVLSATSDPALVRAAFEAGALGFVQKHESVAEILAALHRLDAGEVAIDPRLLRLVMRQSQPAAREDVGNAGPLRLTAREQQVLVHIVGGDTTAEIGRALGVAPSTARTHVQNVLVKLGVHSRLQAAAFAVRHHLVDESALGSRWPSEKQVRRA
jgi:two-component system, NarL family, nitrate/nitrite response regulator NarL